MTAPRLGGEGPAPRRKGSGKERKMDLSQREKQLIIEAVFQAAQAAGVEDRAHRMQLASNLLRSQAEQRLELKAAIVAYRGRLQDTLNGLADSVAQQTTQITNLLEEVDVIITKVGAE